MRYLFCFLSLILSVSSFLGAINRPDPGHYELNLEVLYLHPAAQFSPFVISTEGSSTLLITGRRRDNNLTFYPAYRAEGAYGFCNCLSAIEGRFTFLEAHRSRLISAAPETYYLPTDIFSGAIFNAIAYSQNTFQYYGADITMSQVIYDCLPLELSVFGGVQYARIKAVKESLVSGTTDIGGGVASSADMVTKSTHWGVGPEIGGSFTYALPFCCLRGLAVEGSGRGALLISRTRTNYNARQLINDTESILFFQGSPAWTVNPTFELSLGFNYIIPTECFKRPFRAALAIGYDLIYYADAIEIITVRDFSSGGGPPRDEYQPFTLHGPYASLELRF